MSNLKKICIFERNDALGCKTDFAMDTIHQRFPQYDEGGQALIDKAYAIASAEARFGNDNSILSSLLGVLRHAKATPY